MEADCISQGNAGIIYGLTGVCHQIANRILSAADIKIPPKWPQVRQSYVLYRSAYGWSHPHQKPNDRWPDRKYLCSGTQQLSSNLSSSSSDPSINNGSQGMVQLTTDFASESHADLSEIIKAGLGHRVDDRTLDGLAKMQTTLQDKQEKLATLVIEKKISRTAYIDRLQTVLTEARSAGIDLLGQADFRKVFGEFNVEQLMVPADFIDDNN